MLTRDPFSILAALCRRETPIPPNDEESDGGWFIDRDWFIFRHIFLFLTSNTLPRDRLLLQEMYIEAFFYRLKALQLAIEELPPSHFSPISQAPNFSSSSSFHNSSEILQEEDFSSSHTTTHHEDDMRFHHQLPDPHHFTHSSYSNHHPRNSQHN